MLSVTGRGPNQRTWRVVGKPRPAAATAPRATGSGAESSKTGFPSRTRARPPRTVRAGRPRNNGGRWCTGWCGGCGYSPCPVFGAAVEATRLPPPGSVRPSRTTTSTYPAWSFDVRRQIKQLLESAASSRPTTSGSSLDTRQPQSLRRAGSLAHEVTDQFRQLRRHETGHLVLRSSTSSPERRQGPPGRGARRPASSSPAEPRPPGPPRRTVSTSQLPGAGVDHANAGAARCPGSRSRQRSGSCASVPRHSRRTLSRLLDARRRSGPGKTRPATAARPCLPAAKGTQTPIGDHQASPTRHPVGADHARPGHCDSRDCSPSSSIRSHFAPGGLDQVGRAEAFIEPDGRDRQPLVFPGGVVQRPGGGCGMTCSMAADWPRSAGTVPCSAAISAEVA